MTEFRMVDIHMHVVPRVDDGSMNLEMSKQMLEMAYAQGVRGVAATPHSFAYDYGGAAVGQAFARLREAVAELFPGLTLVPGCEVRCEPDSMGRTLDALAAGFYPSINGTPYVLTEFSTRVTAGDALAMVRLLRGAGWKPVLAHVERYRELFRQGEAGVTALLETGCLVQINAYSLAGESDGDISARARRLLEGQKVAFLGSDAHRTTHRAPRVERGLQYLYQSCDRAYADAVAFGNGEELLRIRPL